MKEPASPAFLFYRRTEHQMQRSRTIVQAQLRQLGDFFIRKEPPAPLA